MNTKLYLKQAWELLKQNRLFSTLYIVGTALAIAMTMMMAVIYYVRLAPVYPEERRGTTLYINGMKCSQTFDGGWSWQTGGFSHRAVTEWLRPLEDAEVVSAHNYGWRSADFVQLPDGREDEPVAIRLTDPEFFRLYTFRFKDGAAFTQDDFDGGMYRAVITDRLARMLFNADTGVKGRTFSVNYKTFTVCGVVEAPSRLMENSYADIYAPYSIVDDYRKGINSDAWEMGPYSVTIVARNRDGIDRIRRAIDEHVQRFNTSHEKENMTLEITSQPHGEPPGRDGYPQDLRGVAQHLAEYGALGEPAAHLHRRTDRAGDGVDMPLPGQGMGVHHPGQLCHPCAGRCRLRQRRDAFRPAGFSLRLRSVPRAESVVGLHPCLVVVASSHCPILV